MRFEEFVLTDNIDYMKDKFKKLNKKAEKLNCTPITITVTKETKIEKEKINNREVVYHYTKVIIDGEQPKLNGWSVTAIKTRDEAIGTVIDSVPEREMPHEFRDTGFPCEHCGHNRQRNKTYILQKNVNELTEDEIRYL